MRTIKFRVFDTEYQKYTTPQDWSISALNGSVRGKYGEEFPEFIVEQFTGLHDKNGKEIYENDVVRAIVNVHGRESDLSFNAYIRFNEHVGCYQIAYKNIEDKEVWDNIGFRYFLEVIGNIHENPELLK